MSNQHLIVSMDDLGDPKTARGRSEEASELKPNAEEQNELVLVVNRGRGTHPAKGRFAVDLECKVSESSRLFWVDEYK